MPGIANHQLQRSGTVERAARDIDIFGDPLVVAVSCSAGTGCLWITPWLSTGAVMSGSSAMMPGLQQPATTNEKGV